VIANFLGLKFGGFILKGDTDSAATLACYYLFRDLLSVAYIVVSSNSFINSC
jgi:hypothetical protein